MRGAGCAGEKHMPKKRKSRDQDGVYRRPDSPYWWASFIDESGKRVLDALLDKRIAGKR